MWTNTDMHRSRITMENQTVDCSFFFRAVSLICINCSHDILIDLWSLMNFTIHIISRVWSPTTATFLNHFINQEVKLSVKKGSYTLTSRQLDDWYQGRSLQENWNPKIFGCSSKYYPAKNPTHAKRRI